LIARLWHNSGVKLLVFSDIHTDYAALVRLMEIEADCYIAAGDLTTWGRGLERCGAMLRGRADRVWVLPGNHESERQIADFCAKYGLHDFHGKTFSAGGYTVAGLGYSTPTPFNTPGEYTEETMARRLEPFAGLEPLVLICHCPPLGTDLDRVRKGIHAGSRAVRDFIERQQPAYFFSGHIHETEGVEMWMGKTHCWNPGRRGYLLDL
jgi:Icc-related predicted phosphoesterase